MVRLHAYVEHEHHAMARVLLRPDGKVTRLDVATYVPTTVSRFINLCCLPLLLHSIAQNLPDLVEFVDCSDGLHGDTHRGTEAKMTVRLKVAQLR